MLEKDFQKKLIIILKDILGEEKEGESGIFVREKEKLLYKVEHGKFTGEEELKKGLGAFETDVLILHKDEKGNKKPLVVIELKNRIDTHDVIVYSNKAMRHKNIYPCLRYGLLSFGLRDIKGRFFTHNNFLDFYLSVGYKQGKLIKIISKEKLTKIISKFLKSEIKIYFETEEILKRCRKQKKIKTSFYQKVPFYNSFDIDSKELFKQTITTDEINKILDEKSFSKKLILID